jgi:hypothetical protein
MERKLSYNHQKKNTSIINCITEVISEYAGKKRPENKYLWNTNSPERDGNIPERGT